MGWSVVLNTAVCVGAIVVDIWVGLMILIPVWTLWMNTAQNVHMEIVRQAALKHWQKMLSQF